MIYLDNASTSCPKPESVYQAMDEFMRKKCGNPGRGGHSMAVAATETIEETRRLIAQFINATEKDRVIFALNCTLALNLGLKGLLKPGDHVITDSIEHNSVIRPLKKLERKGIIITKISPSLEGDFLSPQDIKKSIKGETKLLVVNHASNVTGTIQPVAEYGAIAREHKLIFMVDAAQTAGKYSIDVHRDYIDLLAFSGHKGLLGPPGTGVLYVGERVELESIFEGGTGTHSEKAEQPKELPFRYECGTSNSVGICGLGAGLKYINNEGIDKIQNHEHGLIDRLIEGLTDIPGLTLYIAKNRSYQAAVISFNIDGLDPAEVEAILDQAFDIKVRAGLHCTLETHKNLNTYPKGTIRLSPGYFNTEEEIDRVVQAVEKIARAQTPNYS